ncbi:MAG: peptide chain release factor N(5)-glutamine methyltransferase [Planctomycetaceae bacterium]
MGTDDHPTPPAPLSNAIPSGSAVSKNAATAHPSASEEVWTVQRILEWTTGFLKQKGIESPRLEAELLLSHARQCQRIRLYTDFDAVVSDTERSRMREMVQRRAKREPLAYLVGSKEFYGRSFEVGKGVLIPRPETETLIDVCLERLPRNESRHIAEVGFGSGCISITLAKQCPQLTIQATDPSPEAMHFATHNSSAHKVQDRIQLVNGDCLRAFLPKNSSEGTAAGFTPSFDGIVSNPPYIRIDEMAALQPEVGLHEPHEALVSGEDGLDITRRIIHQATMILKPNAFIAFELDPAQCQTVESILRTTGFTATGIRKDLSGNDRVVFAEWPGQ